MKLFKTYKKLLLFVMGYDEMSKYGLSPPSKLHKYFFYFTSRFAYVVLLTSFIGTGCYLIFVANTNKSYTDYAVIFAAIIEAVLMFATIKWKSQSMFEMFNRCEKLIEERKYIFCFQYYFIGFEFSSKMLVE